MVLGVALVDVILSNIYRVLSIGFPRVIARGDLKNFKALAHYSLTAPPHTHTHSTRLVTLESGKTFSVYKQPCAIL